MDKFLLPDASSLIALQELDLIRPFLDCTTKNGWKVIITSSICKEIINPFELKVLIKEKVSTNEVIIENNYDTDILLLRFPQLGPGEASILCICKDKRYARSRKILIFDERKARKIANNNGYEITGTIGIIKALKKRGYISGEKIKRIKQIFPSIMYCSPHLIEEINGDC